VDSLKALDPERPIREADIVIGDACLHETRISWEIPGPIAEIARRY
jgi:hypothetical protein